MEETDPFLNTNPFAELGDGEHDDPSNTSTASNLYHSVSPTGSGSSSLPPAPKCPPALMGQGRKTGRD